jgi:hypothetical protein
MQRHTSQGGGGDDNSTPPWRLTVRAWVHTLSSMRHHRLGWWWGLGLWLAHSAHTHTTPAMHMHACHSAHLEGSHHHGAQRHNCMAKWETVSSTHPVRERLELHAAPTCLVHWLLWGNHTCMLLGVTQGPNTSGNAGSQTGRSNCGRETHMWCTPGASPRSPPHV